MLMGKEFDLQNMGHLGLYFIFSDGKTGFFAKCILLVWFLTHKCSLLLHGVDLSSLSTQKAPYMMHCSVTTWCCESLLGQLPIRPANSGGKVWTGVNS